MITREYILLGPPNLQMSSSDDQNLKDEVLLFFYVELSGVITQKLIFGRHFGRHVPQKLTFWETVSEEIPKSSFCKEFPDQRLATDSCAACSRWFWSHYDNDDVDDSGNYDDDHCDYLYDDDYDIHNNNDASYLLLHKCTNHLLDVQCRNIVPDGVWLDNSTWTMLTFWCNRFSYFWPKKRPRLLNFLWLSRLFSFPAKQNLQPGSKWN